jgi:hypothetical protein
LPSASAAPPASAAPSPRRAEPAVVSAPDLPAVDARDLDDIIAPGAVSGDALVRWAGYAMIAALAAGVVAGVGFFGPRYFASRKAAPAALAAPPPAATMPRPAPGGAAAASAPIAAAVPTGSLDIRTDPDGATVLIDGKVRGTTPMTVDAIPAGPHTITLQSDQGSVERRIDVRAGATANVEEAIYSGWLHVTSSIELTITEGSRGILLNDESAVMLSPGPHTLRFENRAANFSVTRQVVIKPGETMAISIVPGEAVKMGPTR